MWIGSCKSGFSRSAWNKLSLNLVYTSIVSPGVCGASLKQHSTMCQSIHVEVASWSPGRTIYPATKVAENVTRKFWRLMATPWLCFFGRYTLAIKFWLYSLFLRHSLVSKVWTFGQIIAVTVWAPSIVKFLYIEKGNMSQFGYFPLTHTD